MKKQINKLLELKNDELIKSSMLVVLLKGLGILLGYSLTIVISKKFGPIGLGIYSIAFTTLIVYSYISSFGLTTSILRYIGQYSKPNEAYQRKTLYLFSLKIILMTSIILSFLLFIFSEEIATFLFKDSSYEITLKLVSLVAPFFTLHLINIEYLRGLKKIVLSEIFRTTLIPFLCITGIMVYSNYKNIQWPVYVLGYTVFFLAIVSTIIIGIRLIKIKTTSTINLKLNELLKTSSPMMLIALSSYFIGNISVYVIQILESTYQVGIYALALKISLFISFILIGINTVIAPKISELYWDKKKEELSQLIQQKTKFIFLLSLPLFFGIVFFSRSIITLINEEFIAGTTVLVVLAFGQLINATCGPVGLLLNMTGNQKALMKVTVSILIITIILNIVFVYHLGILGAAYATAISIVVKNVVLVVVAKRKLNILTLYLPFSNKK